MPIILVEYGDKMSPAIWDAMKRPFSGAAAAPSPAQLPGQSLYSLQRWADQHGYDSFLLGSIAHRPVLIGLTGPLWRDEYEVCRDKSQKFSSDGKLWRNFTAWNPQWSAVCWYDVAMVLRRPRQPLMRQLLLERTALPSSFCQRLTQGWYPRWIDEPPPLVEDLCCSHRVGDPRQGHVCHSFFNCTSLRMKAMGRQIAQGHGQMAVTKPKSHHQAMSKGKGKGKGQQQGKLFTLG